MKKKKEGYRRKTTFEKKKNGFRPGPGHGLTGSCRLVAPAGLSTNSDRSITRLIESRVDPSSRSGFNNCDYN